MFKVSPHTHPESPISGSTVEAMIDMAATLGRSHFAYTDMAYMTSIYRAYEYCKIYNGKEDKKGKFRPKMGFIPGVEVFFKDDNCDIIKGTKGEKSSYFKLTLYATNQEQFQKLASIVSRPRSKYTTHYGETYPCWNWSDLEDCALSGILCVSSDLHDIVAKHIVTNSAHICDKIILRLKSMFGERYSISIVGNVTEKTWMSLVEFELADGTKHVVQSNSRVATNAAKFAQAKELVENAKKHHSLVSFQNNYATKTLPAPLRITKAKLHSGFMPIPGGDIQLKANKLMYALAERHEIKTIYSDYAFYASPEDKAVQDVRLSQDDIKEHTKRHMQGPDEAASYLTTKLGLSKEKAERILLNNSEWAKQFDSFSLSYDYHLPKYEGSDTTLEKCLKIVKEMGRLPSDKPEYLERLRSDIAVLAKNGKVDLTPYFLPIYDVFEFYRKSKRLTGPGRGSAPGNLLLYLMGITHVDPIKYELSSERFLSLDRVLTGSFPDVDVDLVDRTPLVGDDGKSGYLYSRWGDKAAQISTRIQLRLKSSIRDVNKYFNNNEKIDEDVEKFSKSLPAPPQGVSDLDFVFGFEDSDGNHTPGLIEVDEGLKKYAQDRPKEWEIVQKCLGISRQNSKHASAFVISDVPISDVVPVFMDNVTQYEAKSVEKAKLIKYDFLVVNQLKDIEGCINRINKKNKNDLEVGKFIHNGSEVYVWDLPEDQKVYESVWGGDTETVFQINTQSMIPFVRKIKPKSIVDLATILALVRPGPMDFVDPDTGLTMADEYVERRYGRGTIKLPELSRLIPETYGVMVFQEQNSKVAKEIGKMKPSDAEELRRIFSKKEKAKALAMKPKFMEGAETTVGKEKAEMIWGQMETSARYNFNRSHAVSYAIISYACMFLKYHYPLEWWASVLSNADEEEISTTLFKHVRDKVLPPDINLSSNEMEIDYENQKIRSKMTVLRGLGDTVSAPIIQGAPYADIKDFIKKKVAGPSLTEKLILVGVMDSLFPRGSSLIDKMQIYKDTINEVVYEEKIEKGKKAKPPQKGEVDPKYLSMSPLQDFKAKKTVLATLPINLSNIVAKYCPIFNEGTVEAPMFGNEKGRASRMLSGDMLEEIQKRAPFPKDSYFCVPAFVVDMKEFYFSNNEKKALKMFLDIDGKVTEKVLWPAWGENFVKYPSDLKKNSVILMFMGLKEAKTEPKIFSIKIIA